MYPHDVEENQKSLMRMRTLFFFGIGYNNNELIILSMLTTIISY
jgi:hypothetical protein